MRNRVFALSICAFVRSSAESADALKRQIRWRQIRWPGMDEDKGHVEVIRS
jgi:hypothetical protein